MTGVDGEAVLHAISQGLTDFGAEPFTPDIELALLDAMEQRQEPVCLHGFTRREHINGACPGMPSSYGRGRSAHP